jgi:flagellar motor switch protein FliG
MTDPSMAEVSRRLDSHTSQIRERVLNEVYVRDREEIRKDIEDLRASIRSISDNTRAWTRMIIGSLVASVFTALMMVVVTILLRT